MIELCVVFLMFVVFPMVLGARSRIARLEQRIKLLEQQSLHAFARYGADSREGMVVAAVADPVPEVAVAPEREQEPIIETLEEAEVQEPAIIAAPPPPPPASLKERRVAYIAERAAKIAAPFESTAKPAEPVEDKPAEAIVPEEAVISKQVKAEEAASGYEAEASNNYGAPPVKPRSKSFNFEELFGRKLPIWAGGITLAIAGILIVKYAIDAGFFAKIFTPGVQAICGLIFGTGLIGGAEWAYRKRDTVDDPRVSQALSGAGISTLYASVLVAANLYNLISPLTAFIGLAAVTAAAMGLSLRHGTPSALLGLVGGLATPALTSALDVNVPMLSIYLAFTIAGLVGVSRMQRWPWLALLAIIGGAGWSLWLVLFGQALTMVGALSVGGFIMLLAIALPMFAFRDKAAVLLRSASAVVGALQLGLLVALGGFQPLHWGLFILIAAMGQWLAWRDRQFAIVPTLSAVLSAILLLYWPTASAYWLTLIGLALTVIHALPLIMRMWQDDGKLQRAFELCAIAIAIPLVTLRHLHAPWGEVDGISALTSAAAALMLLVTAALGWKQTARQNDSRFAMLIGVGAGLLSVAAWLGFAHWQIPLWVAAISVALLFLSRPSDDARIEPVATAYFSLSLAGLFMTLIPDRFYELGALVDQGAGAQTSTLLRWGGLAIAAGLFAWRADRLPNRLSAYLVCAGMSYGLLAQLVPGWTLPIMMAAIAAITLVAMQWREEALTEVQVVPLAAASALLLAITGPDPLAEWQRLFGNDAVVTAVQSFARWIAVAALGLFFTWRARLEPMRALGQFAAMGFAYGALAQILPGWTMPLALAAVGVAALLGMQRFVQAPREGQLYPVLLGVIGLLAITGANPANEWLRLIGEGTGYYDGIAFARWLGLAAFAALLAVKAGAMPLRNIAQGVAAVAGYGALAQLAPTLAVPLIAPVAVLGLALWSQRIVWPQLRVATAVLAAIALGWTMLPMMIWSNEALLSLSGIAMELAPIELDISSIARRLLAPALLLGLALWTLRGALSERLVKAGIAVVGVIAMVGIHSLYRQGFAMAFGADFTATGLGQRLLWNGLLLAAAFALWKKGRGMLAQIAAPAILVANALHLLWYSLVLHNPLWTSQAVGAIPLANMILPLAAGLPLSLWLLAKMRPDHAAKIDRIAQPLYMVMIAGFGWATLRQAFHGTMLVDPGVSQFEDILRSILGIALAIGYLLWGIKVRRRNWRIASLFLILAAVAKVFLLDASGLEGLLRIASFVALGFSLIGIGWLYSRQLKSEEPAVEKE
jgi:uncharacterized membrane protein